MTQFNKDEFNKENVWRILEDKPGTWYQDADASERALLKEWTQGLLKEQAVKIEFVKSDGSVREMTCTLNESLGAVHVNTTQDTRPRNTEVCTVWDCEQQAWRSFRWDRLQRIGVTL